MYSRCSFVRAPTYTRRASVTTVRSYNRDDAKVAGDDRRRLVKNNERRTGQTERVVQITSRSYWYSAAGVQGVGAYLMPMQDSEEVNQLGSGCIQGDDDLILVEIRVCRCGAGRISTSESCGGMHPVKCSLDRTELAQTLAAKVVSVVIGMS